MKREQIVEVLKNRLQMAKKENNPTETAFLEKVIKAVDVAEVRHGEWVKIFDFDGDKRLQFMCSKCGRGVFVYPNEFDKIAEIFPYCHCGAKMDGKDGAGE
jgi:hypothetical protein